MKACAKVAAACTLGALGLMRQGAVTTAARPLITFMISPAAAPLFRKTYVEPAKP